MVEISNQTYAILAIAALVSLFPGLGSRPDGVIRRGWAMAAWFTGLAALALRMASTMINDDEVAWLAKSWASAHGEVVGELPMRLLPFRPLLALGLPAGLTVMLGRLLVVALAVACGLILVSLARRIGCPSVIASLVGAVALMWLATWGEMGFLRPEYLALVLFLGGVWLLVSPPRRWRRELALGLAFALLTLAASTSQRHALYPLAGLVAVALWPPEGVSRGRGIVSALAGAAVGALPSVLYLLCTGSLGAVYQAKGADTLRSGILTFGAPARFPVFLIVSGLVGAWMLWRNRRADPGQAALGALWVAATAAVILNPLRQAYAMCPWFALSALGTGAFASATLRQGDARAGRRWCMFALVAVAAAAFGGSSVIPKVPLLISPSRVVSEGRTIGSQLRLMDWIGEVAQAGPVVCVVPCHPVRAANAWRSWDAWAYCYLSDPHLNRQLTMGLADMLQSGTPSVIAWDPWPEKSECANILRYAERRGSVAAERLDQVASALRAQYQLVQWAEPIPAVYGSGRFLVRRDIALDGRVVAVDEGVVTDWRQGSAPPH